jgi:hypothetical protein
MSAQLLPPEMPFRVEVDISSTCPTYTYYNQKGTTCTGDVDVTAADTAITYTLVNNKEQLIFAAPIVDAKDPEDLIIIISPDQQTVTIHDCNSTTQTIHFRLVVVKVSEPNKPYISPDPIIRNIPN